MDSRLMITICMMAFAGIEYSSGGIHLEGDNSSHGEIGAGYAEPALQVEAVYAYSAELPGDGEVSASPGESDHSNDSEAGSPETGDAKPSESEIEHAALNATSFSCGLGENESALFAGRLAQADSEFEGDVINLMNNGSHEDVADFCSRLHGEDALAQETPDAGMDVRLGTENGTLSAHVAYNGTDAAYPINSTDREEVVSQLADATGIDRANISSALGRSEKEFENSGIAAERNAASGVRVHANVNRFANQERIMGMLMSGKSALQIVEALANEQLSARGTLEVGNDTYVIIDGKVVGNYLEADLYSAIGDTLVKAGAARLNIGNGTASGILEINGNEIIVH